MSALIRVPKKLEDGMIVVVWIRPHIRLFWREFDAGYRVGKWFKATVVGRSEITGVLEIRFNNCSTYICGASGIVVRSVALADNKTEATERALAKARAKYRAKVLGR